MPTASNVMAAIPVAILGIALGLLIFFTVPPTNHDFVVAIISGLLGYLVRPEKKAEVTL